MLCEYRVEALHLAAIYTVGDLIAHSRKDTKLTALKLSSKTGGEKRAWLRELVSQPNFIGLASSPSNS